MKSQRDIHLSLLTLGAFSSVACGEPLKKAQEIEEARTLAVQIEAEDGSATPAPGQDATARVLFAGPEGPKQVNIAYKICEAADSVRGVPYCIGDVYAEGTERGVDSLAEIEFSVPESAEEGSRIAVLAAACENGEPELAEDPNNWNCGGAEAPLSLSFDGYIGGREPNSNPDLSEMRILVDGQEAVFEDPDQAPDCTAPIPLVDANETFTVSIDYGPSAREEDEWLQVSHFATGGEYERQYTVFEPDEELSMEIEWESPKAGAFKHYVVVRDGLGGVAFATFSVCAE